VASLCPGNNATSELASLTLPICHPVEAPESLQLAGMVPTQAPQGPARIIVISNYYIGCNAGRREANVYSYTSTILHERYPNIIFLSSLKGGSSGQCKTWANRFEQDGAVALGSLSGAIQPWTVHDEASQMRDAFFTAPYPHPSYTIIDYNGQVREKFVGPCCGRADYFDCSTQNALSLNDTLHEKLAPILKEVEDLYGGNADCFFTEWTSWSTCSCSGMLGVNSGTRARSRSILQKPIGGGSCASTSESETCACTNPVNCAVGTWSAWSACSRNCGTGERYRTRAITTQPEFNGTECPDVAEVESCQGPSTPCQQQCVPLLGKSINTVVVATSEEGLSSPRDLAFSPFPGRHLGTFSEGRSFPTSGLEAWVANGHGHSVTILPGISTGNMSSLTRYDRGWFHYMMNITALSFNMLTDSGRAPDRDTVGFFATCQDNNNTYSGLKDPNFFQGPTLYSSAPAYKNLVRHDGGECGPADECFFLHADMLHESPSCPGIVHDPETKTAYGTVFWAIDGVAGHLVRYDFQQPHGPGLMDHSVASVRRYPEVQIARGRPGLHQGLAVDAAARVLYVAAAGSGQVHKVFVDSGQHMRTAREEYPVFSSQLPSFEYSIWACVEQEVFAVGLNEPSGLVILGGQLFVAEHGTGNIVVFDLATGLAMQSYAASAPGLMGLALSPSGDRLFGVNAETEELLEFRPAEQCAPGEPYANPDYQRPASIAAPSGKPVCSPNTSIPDANLFVQVHTSTGYASNDSSVQNDSMMDSSAAELQNRTDCEHNSSLNFDALLLGGWHCHRCLPDNCALRDGGRCQAIQWAGYTCDNEVHVTLPEGSDSVLELPDGLQLEVNRTYRLIVNAKGSSIYVASQGIAMTPAVEVGTLRVNVTELDTLPDALVGPDGKTLCSIFVKGTSTSSTTSTTTSSVTTSTPASSDDAVTSTSTAAKPETSRTSADTTTDVLPSTDAAALPASSSASAATMLVSSTLIFMNS